MFTGYPARSLYLGGIPSTFIDHVNYGYCSEHSEIATLFDT